MSKLTGNELVHPDIVTEPARDQQYGSTYGDTYSHGGITIRQHFASLFLQGLIASGNILGTHAYSETAVKFADDLIAELNKEK